MTRIIHQYVLKDTNRSGTGSQGSFSIFESWYQSWYQDCYCESLDSSLYIKTGILKSWFRSQYQYWYLKVFIPVSISWLVYESLDSSLNIKTKDHKSLEYSLNIKTHNLRVSIPVSKSRLKFQKFCSSLNFKTFYWIFFYLLMCQKKTQTLNYKEEIWNDSKNVLDNVEGWLVIEIKMFYICLGLLSISR